MHYMNVLLWHCDQACKQVSNRYCARCIGFNRQYTLFIITLIGIVFSQDDYRVCLASGILQKGGKLPCPVDACGMFTSEVSDFKGQHVKVTVTL